MKPAISRKYAHYTLNDEQSKLLGEFFRLTGDLTVRVMTPEKVKQIIYEAKDVVE